MIQIQTLITDQGRPGKQTSDRSYKVDLKKLFFAFPGLISDQEDGADQPAIQAAQVQMIMTMTD